MKNFTWKPRRSLLALAILSATGSVLADEKTHHLSIAPQNISDALKVLANETHIQIFSDGEALKGKKTSGIQGDFTAKQAIQKLLAGTGLTYTFTADDAVAVKAADVSSDASTLPAVKVTGKAQHEPTDPYNTDYNLKKSTTATKTDTALMETPVSVQIVSQQLMKDQQTIRLEDALKNVSGVRREVTYGSANIYESFTMRGFDSQGAVYRNGIRLYEQTFETANLQQIEVLKGPASVLYGRTEPGGLVNITTKKPLDTPYYALEQQIGSYDLYRSTIDATGPLNKDKTLLYRLNMAYQDSNSFRDLIDKERKFVAPSLSWLPNDKFELNLNFEYRNDRFHGDGGIPPIGNRPANVPISFSFTDAPLVSTLESYTSGMDWTFKFNDNWKLTNRFLYQQSKYNWNDLWQGGAYQENGRWLMDRSWIIQGPGTTNNYATNLDLTGNFNTFGIKHTALFGFDYYLRERHDFNNNWGPLDLADAPPMDVFNPVHGLMRVPRLQPNASWLDESDWFGLYLQDQMTFFDKLHILMGGRYDNALRQSAYGSTPESLHPTPETISEFNPRFGFVYQPWQWLSVYGNYTESVGRYNGLGANNVVLNAEHAKQYEIGLKNEFLDGALSSTLAYFHIDKTNVATPDFSTVDNPYDSRSVGGIRSQGLELDVTGKITDKLSMIGSYAYTDARVTKDFDNNGGSGNTGNRYFNVPEHSASLWSKYDIDDHFTVGTGTYLAGSRQGDLVNSYQMPGYVRWDLMAAYKTRVGKSKLTTQLNVNNILDKHYYLSSNSGPQILPADPLSFIGSVKLEY